MKPLFFLLPVLVLVISCGKDDKPNPPAGKTKTEIITQTAWKFESAGTDDDKNGVIETDATALINPCFKDNTFKFETNGSGLVNEGPTLCASSPGQTVPFNWAFLTNETELNVTGSAVQGFSGQYKIITLTDTKMSLSRDTTLGAYGSHTLIANFIH